MSELQKIVPRPARVAKVRKVCRRPSVKTMLCGITVGTGAQENQFRGGQEYALEQDLIGPTMAQLRIVQTSGTAESMSKRSERL